MSVLNMSMQIPVHAAMQMSHAAPQLSVMDHSAMNHADMGHLMSDSEQSCHCPPALCDSVLAQDNQSTDGAFSFIIGNQKSGVRVIETLDQNLGQFNLFRHFAETHLSALQFSEPLLLTKTLLLI